MKKMILAIAMLLMISGIVYAAEICTNITAATDAQLGRQSTRIGVTKEVFMRQALKERLGTNRESRKESLMRTYSNYSSFCADHNYCD